MYIPCRILTAPVGRVWRLIAFSRRSAPKNTIRLPSLLIATAQEWRQEWITLPWYSNAKWIHKEKYRKRKLSPLVGEGVNRQVDGRGKLEQKRKTVFYKTVLNTCPSFLNEVKNLGKEYEC